MCLWEGNGSEILKGAWRERDIRKQKDIEWMLWKEAIGATKLFSIDSNNKHIMVNSLSIYIET